MKKLKYYKDLDHNFLFAYEASTEFFVIYNPESKKWTDCNISFSNFKHDYYFAEIDREEAFRATNGSLPETEFQQYLALLQRN